jgi:hypothetical protein
MHFFVLFCCFRYFNKKSETFYRVPIGPGEFLAYTHIAWLVIWATIVPEEVKHFWAIEYDTK